MSYESICLKGGHTLVKEMSCGKCMCLWSVCLHDGIFYNMLCFIGRHFLLDDLFYLRVCIIGGHVLQLEMSYWNTCFTGVHILPDDLSNRRAPLR